MKVSQEEIDAALAEKLSMSGADDERDVMMRILQAAYTVRKQRKAAKCERQRKEKDNTIQKLAADMMTWCGKTLPEMTTDELVSARDELAGFESMSLRENGFYHRMNAEITARKEKDKQVVESVKPENYYGFATGVPLNRLFPEITPFQAPEWAVTKAVEMWKYYKFPSGLGDGDKIQAIARILAEDAIPAKSELS